MMRLNLFKLAFMLYANVLASQVDTHSNLVICMPMNGNAQDMSGNNNHGIVNGAVLTSDRFGTPNSAYHFNGIDVYKRQGYSP